MYRVAVGVVALILVSSACGEADPRSGGASTATAEVTAPTDDADDEPDVDETVDGAEEGAGGASSPDAPEGSDGIATTKPASPPGDAQQEDTMDEDGPVAQAIHDLAAQTGANPDDINVVVHEEVTWRDGSLGCPKPGMNYTQALVEGYRIVLHADGEEFTYHGQRGKPPFRCDRPDPDGAVNMGPNR